MRMEIDEFESPAQSAANGVVCAAGGTVVPRDQQCGVLDKVIVTHGITPCMIGRGECHLSLIHIYPLSQYPRRYSNSMPFSRLSIRRRVSRLP